MEPETTPPTTEPQYDYDVIVIGGGSGGLAAAKEAALYGVRVCCFDYVEPSNQGTVWGLGGTCVNVGCIPKKLMHRAANIHGDLEDARSFGWQVDPAAVRHNWETLVDAVRGHIGSLNWGYMNDLPKKGVNYINGFATFEAPHTLSYREPDGKTGRVTGNQIIIAVGGRPVFPDIPGAREHCITSDDLFYLDHPPGKTLVVGASYVALECAGLLTHLGFDTTVMVRSILLRGFDLECATKIGDYMEAHGTKFVKETVPTRVEKLPSGKLRVTAMGPEARAVVEEYDTVLLAIGRVPNTKSLHLERVGVNIDPRTGKLPCVNDTTNVPYIHVIGDAQLGAPELTPTAIMCGRLLSRRIVAGMDEQMSYDYVPTTVFTPLEYGCIGMSEERAKEQFGADNIEVYHSAFRPLEWSVCEHRPHEDGFCKLICNRAAGMRVVGLHYLGPNAGEVTNGWAVAMRMGATKHDFDMGIGIHPTCAENLNGLTVTKSSGASAKKGGC